MVKRKSSRKSKRSSSRSKAKKPKSTAKKRKPLSITPHELKIVDLELEKSRLNRERSILLLNKSFLFYFAFLIFAIFGFVNQYIGKELLNMLVLIGLAIIVVGTFPYVRTMKAEEQNIDKLISELRGK